MLPSFVCWVKLRCRYVSRTKLNHFAGSMVGDFNNSLKHINSTQPVVWLSHEIHAIDRCRGDDAWSVREHSATHHLNISTRTSCLSFAHIEGWIKQNDQSNATPTARRSSTRSMSRKGNYSQSASGVWRLHPNLADLSRKRFHRSIIIATKLFSSEYTHQHVHCHNSVLRLPSTATQASSNSSKWYDFS